MIDPAKQMLVAFIGGIKFILSQLQKGLAGGVRDRSQAALTASKLKQNSVADEVTEPVGSVDCMDHDN